MDRNGWDYDSCSDDEGGVVVPVFVAPVVDPLVGVEQVDITSGDGHN